MIDFSNEIFSTVAESLRSAFKGITVKGEYVDVPSQFPTVTIDEIRNIPFSVDGARENKYARVTYRIQVFSNKEDGKRAEARNIYKKIDEVLQQYNLLCEAFTTTPTIYNAEVYSITATHSGVVSRDGVFYRG